MKKTCSWRTAQFQGQLGKRFVLSADRCMEESSMLPKANGKHAHLTDTNWCARFWRPKWSWCNANLAYVIPLQSIKTLLTEMFRIPLTKWWRCPLNLWIHWNRKCKTASDCQFWQWSLCSVDCVSENFQRKIFWVIFLAVSNYTRSRKMKKKPYTLQGSARKSGWRLLILDTDAFSIVVTSLHCLGPVDLSRRLKNKVKWQKKFLTWKWLEIVSTAMRWAWNITYPNFVAGTVSFVCMSVFFMSGMEP